MAADVLPEPQVTLLTTIYEGLKQRGNWPPFSYVDQMLARLELDLDKVADDLPADMTNLGPGVRHVSGDDEVTMTIAGLYHCRGAQNDLDLILQAVSIAVVIERSQEPSVEGGIQPTLTSKALAELGADDATLKRLQLFMRFEPWGGGGSVTADGWDITITRAIRRFGGITTIEEYLQRRTDFYGQTARVPPAVRLGFTPSTVLGISRDDGGSPPSNVAARSNPRSSGAHKSAADSALAPTIARLHPAVVIKAYRLFDDGHYASAVFEAFKAIEVRVAAQSGLDISGRPLMAAALADGGPIQLAAEIGGSTNDEQEGFKLLFMGAIQGIRNPKAHTFDRPPSAQRAAEYLSLASVMLRRLDDARHVQQKRDHEDAKGGQDRCTDDAVGLRVEHR